MTQPEFNLDLNFNHHVHDWFTFKKRLEFFFIKHDITVLETSKKCTILINALAPDTLKVAQEIVQPRKLEHILRYDELVETFDKKFTMKDAFACRQDFYALSQNRGERIADWAARVFSVAQKCSFGTELEVVVRDRFVLGMESSAMREKLLCEKDISFAEAVSQAQSICHIPKVGISAVNKMYVPVLDSSAGCPFDEERCNVCGTFNHRAEDCKFANKKCTHCQEYGHHRRMCRQNSGNHNSNDSVKQSEGK